MFLLLYELFYTSKKVRKRVEREEKRKRKKKKRKKKKKKKKERKEKKKNIIIIIKLKKNNLETELKCFPVKRFKSVDFPEFGQPTIFFSFLFLSFFSLSFLSFSLSFLFLSLPFSLLLSLKMKREKRTQESNGERMRIFRLVNNLSNIF